MLKILLIVTILLSSLVVYQNKRFTSEKKLYDIYLTQLYYLVAGTIIALLFIHIGLEIVQRPQVFTTPFDTSILLNLFISSITIAAMGNAIHSTSTSVSQAFPKAGKKSEALKLNEKIHGSISHNMVYVGAIFGQILLALIEMNYPISSQVMNWLGLVLVGVILGIVEYLAILRGGHIGFSLVASFFGALLINYYIRRPAVDIQMYPATVIFLVALSILFLGLILTTLVFLASDTLSRFIIWKTFPKGHSWHEAFSIKVLTIKIEKRFLKEARDIMHHKKSTPYH